MQINVVNQPGKQTNKISINVAVKVLFRYFKITLKITKCTKQMRLKLNEHRVRNLALFSYLFAKIV